MDDMPGDPGSHFAEAECFLRLEDLAAVKELASNLLLPSARHFSFDGALVSLDGGLA